MSPLLGKSSGLSAAVDAENWCVARSIEACHSEKRLVMVRIDFANCKAIVARSQ